MTLPAHIAGGYLALKIANRIDPNFGFEQNSLMLVGIMGALIPDVDYVFFKNIKDHHNGIPHSPLFWILMSSITCLFAFSTENILLMSYIIAFTIGVLVHLFLDWFSGRTAGIRVFYPFSKKVYSLYPLNPKKGEVSTSLIPNKSHLEFFRFYAQNKFLLSVEILIMLIGFGLFIFER